MPNDNGNAQVDDELDGVGSDSREDGKGQDGEGGSDHRDREQNFRHMIYDLMKEDEALVRRGGRGHPYS